MSKEFRLQGEGERVPAAEVSTYLAEGYQQLEADLPQDIRDIYLVAKNENSLVSG
jgi:hypothetical protein